MYVDNGFLSMLFWFGLVVPAIIVVIALIVRWLWLRRQDRLSAERERIDQIITDNLVAFGIPARVSRYWPPEVRRAALAEAEARRMEAE